MHADLRNLRGGVRHRFLLGLFVPSSCQFIHSSNAAVMVFGLSACDIGRGSGEGVTNGV